MSAPMRTPPTYAIAAVDNALRLATILQIEGSITVSEAANRLGVARSTAHRLLAMLVYRDFAVQGDQHIYHAGPVFALAPHAESRTAELRALAIPYLQQLVALFDETASLSILTGEMTRFIATVECRQALRVTSREGMVFPAHRTTTGMLYLASLSTHELAQFFERGWYAVNTADRPDARRLRTDLNRVRRNGFAVNEGRSERGLVALGVAVRSVDRGLVGGLSLSMPSARFDRTILATMASAAQRAARSLETDLEQRYS